VRQTETGSERRNTGRAWEGSKSPEAFRTITEVSNELELPQHVLRFWETKFPQIKPVKRRGGRRYYRPEDIVLIKGIKSLLYVEGYTIKGVQKLLRETGRSAAIDAEAAEATDSSSPDQETHVTSEPESPFLGQLEATLRELEELRRFLGKIVS
jgi:DNA-binding transcriptional MerR regulator